MKKIIVFLGILFLVCGCGKNEKSIVKNLTKKIEQSESYHLSGTLEVYRNEEKYTYNINSSYKKDGYYKVDLVNQNNNHEQIILKNEDGVYVKTQKSTKQKLNII